MTHLGELLSAYLDGELTPEEHNRVTTHLGSCSSCHAELQATQRARAAVRSLPTLEAPHWVLSETVEPAARRPLAWAAAAAAAVLVITIGVAAWLTSPPDLQLEYDDIATTHRVRVSQDGTPTGARIVQIVQFDPGWAE